jgi:hypothetical protein
LAAEWSKNETAFLRVVIDRASWRRRSFFRLTKGDNKRSKHIYLTVRAFLLGLLCLYIPGLRPQQAFICFGQIPSHAAGAWVKTMPSLYVYIFFYISLSLTYVIAALCKQLKQSAQTALLLLC